MIGCKKLSRHLFAALVMSALLIQGAVPSSAQTNEANLSGIVFDSTRAVLPGATVSLVSRGRGITRTTTSNDSGSYQFSFVQPDTYDLDSDGNTLEPRRRPARHRHRAG